MDWSIDIAATDGTSMNASRGSDVAYAIPRSARAFKTVAYLSKLCIIMIAAGPTSTTKIPGKMNRMRGKSICTAVF